VNLIKKAKCPNCNCDIPRFAIKKELYPQNGVWYKFKKIVQKCPFCSKYLDSKLPDFRWCLFLFVPLSITAKNHSHLYEFYLSMALLLVTVLWLSYWLFADNPYKLLDNKNG